MQQRPVLEANLLSTVGAVAAICRVALGVLPPSPKELRLGIRRLMSVYPPRAWMSQELLMTFSDELGEVALLPGSGGIFEVRVDGETVFSKKQAGHFPESKELKQLIRDRIAPGKDLGHSDRG